LIVYRDLKLEKSLNFVSHWLFSALVDGDLAIRDVSFPLFFVKQRKIDFRTGWFRSNSVEQIVQAGKQVAQALHLGI
jgi:hypothetical protein